MLIYAFSAFILLIEQPILLLDFKSFIKGCIKFIIPYNNHFWFLQQLLIIYLLFPFIKIGFEKYPKYFLFITIFSFVLISCVETKFFEYILSPYNIMFARAPYSIIYFCLGGILEKFLTDREIRIKYRIAISIGIVVMIPIVMLLSSLYNIDHNVGDWVFDGYCTVGTFVLTVMIYLLFRINDTGKYNAFIHVVANQTMFVYIFQMPFIAYYYKFIKPLNFAIFYGNILPAIIILVVLTAVGYLLTKIKFVKWLLKL